MYSDMSITLFYKSMEVRYENKSRVTRLSRRNNRQPDRKQMEAADPAESARQTVEIQRVEKVARRYQPEGADRQPALDGRGLYHHTNRLSRSASESRVRPERPRREYAPDHQVDGNIWDRL